MKYCVCLGVIYYNADVSELIEGMKIVKAAGFDAVEFFSFKSMDDVDRIIECKNELGLDVALFIPLRGSLVDPSERKAYIDGLKDGIQTAKKLECKRMTLFSGMEIQDVPRSVQRRNMVEGLKEIAPMLEEAGIIGVLEPLDFVNNPGYYLTSSMEGFEIIDEVGSPNIKLLYDIYHQQINEGNLIPTIVGNIDKIGHLHAAGHPGRHELNTGEINYSEIIKAVKETGYNGYFGLEYKPSKEILESLKEARRMCI